MKRSKMIKFRKEIKSKLIDQYNLIADVQETLAKESEDKCKGENPKSLLHKLLAFNARQKLLKLGV